MNFYQSVFENICEKVSFWGNYPSIFTLSDQSNDSKKYFLKFRVYITQI